MSIMNKFKTVIILIALVTFISCDDNVADNPPIEPTIEYMPYAVSNYWVYDVESSVNGTSKDSLYISSTVSANNSSYFKFGASDTSTGFATQLYANNLHRKDAENHFIFGEIDLGALLGDQFDLNITLDDEILLSETAQIGTVLAEQSNSITQTFNNIPLQIDYTFKNELKNTLSMLNVNNEEYSDIIQTEITLNVKIVAIIDVLGIQIPYTVLQPQDVIVMTNSYANEVGLIKSDVEFSYQMDEIQGVTLPFPSSSSETMVQEITNYEVNN